MSDSRPETDWADLSRLTELHLGGALTPADAERLSALLKSSAEMRAWYLKSTLVAAMLHERFSTEMRGEADTAEMGPDDLYISESIMREALERRRQSELEKRASLMLEQDRAEAVVRTRQQSAHGSKRILVIPKVAFWGGLAAAVVLLALLLWPEKQPPAPFAAEDATPTPSQPDAPVPAPLPVATLLNQSGAVWAGEAPPRINETMMPGTYELSAGLVRLRFDSEALTIIEAPAVFSLDSQAQLTLVSGKVAAVCETPRSKGFVVQTPDARITDLGTAFSVEHWAGDRTLTQVMDGEVELRTAAASPTDAPVSLTVGQAAIVTDQSPRVQRVPFEVGRASVDWDRLIRRPKLNGSARYALSVPRSLRVGELEDENDIVVLLEQINVRLEQDLPVSFTEPGRYDRAQPTMLASIGANQIVDSYLLHMDTPGNEDATVQLSATITFDRPILGVIIHGNRITASDRVLGHPETTYAASFSGESSRDARGFDLNNDLVVLDGDRRTLTVQLLTSTSLDQVRVLVEPIEDDAPSAIHDSLSSLKLFGQISDQTRVLH